MISNNNRVFVTGHKGMVGSAIMRQLIKLGYKNIITADRSSLDLLNQDDVHNFFKNNDIDCVYLAAAKVGGIHANNVYPAEFIYENLQIQSNVIHAAHINNVNSLLFLGSSCIYPKYAEQPMREDALLTGLLEPTNEPYAIAKIAGIKICDSYNRQYGRVYRSVMPTNLYGMNDNFHLENAHVLPALLRRMHEARNSGVKEVVVWGTGNAMREFLHVDDMARACVFIMEMDQSIYQSKISLLSTHVNIGTGTDCTIRDLAYMLKTVTGYNGEIAFDSTKSDGTPRKLLDVSRLSSMGWKHEIDLMQGLEITYKWFLENYSKIRV